MAKRMDGNETWFRVRVDVAYTIRYQKYNPDWDYQKRTSGDLEGDNPLYVQYAEDTREDWYTYLGPFNSLKALEREFSKFESRYVDGEAYRDLVFIRGAVQTCEWKDV